MSEYATAAGPEFRQRSQPIAPLEPDADERLRRAELFLRLPSLISYDQPLDDVLTTIAQTIVEHTSAVSAAINLVRPSDDSNIALGYCNLPVGYLEGMQFARQNSHQGALLRERAATDTTWVLHQAPDYMLSRPEYVHMTEFIRQLPFDTLIGTPFLNRPESMGFVFLYYTGDAEVDDAEVAFARDLARHARPLMDNAWLFSETRRRASELEALYHADEALHTSLHLEDVLKAMVALAVELMGATSSLVVSWDENDRLTVRETTGVRRVQREQINERYQQTTRERFRDYERPYRTSLIENVNAHPKIDFELKFENPSSVAEIPVVVGDELWGFFSIGWATARSFTDADRRMFDAFASRASLAIQNAMLFEQAQKTASMEERQRIARELHDSVSQALYGIGLGARTARRRLGDGAASDVLEPIDYIVQLAESGLAETRALIFELVPESLEEQGLVLALQRQAAATQARYRVQVSAFLGDEPDIPIRAKEALYRIAQESLHNVAKHADAPSASLRLESADGIVLLVVQDDGKGFDTSGEFPGHLGLRSMEERARRIGGEYSIESTLGRGTTVSVRLPLAAASP